MRRLYGISVLHGTKVFEESTVHLDLDDDPRKVEADLRQLIIDAVERKGWSKSRAWQFRLHVRRPGWVKDEIDPYVIQRDRI